MNEQNKQIALQLRFVLMENAVVMQILDFNKIALGFKKAEKPYLAPPLNEIFEKTNTVPRSVLYEAVPFEHLKTCLDVFAVNAFHGQSAPPVPRIEAREFDYYFYPKNQQPYALNVAEMEDLSNLFGSKILIYEPTAPKFESDWRKEYPREIDKDEIRARVCKDDNYDSENIYFLSTAVKNVIDYTIDQCNKLNAQAGIESWVFTMWKVK